MLGDQFGVLLAVPLVVAWIAAPALATPSVLGPRLDLATPAEPRAVAIGDLNGDGHPDIAVACAADSFVALFFGHGDGTFEPRVDLVAGTNPLSIGIVDWDQDGKNDFLVGTAGASPRLKVFLGDGTGGFVPGASVATPGGGVRLAFADFNSDGRPDLAGVASAGASFGFVELSVPGGGFGAQRTLDGGAGASYSIVATPLNGDATVDVFLPRYCGSCPSKTYAGDGTGNFGFGVNALDAPLSFDAAALDYDGDARQDLVVTGGVPPGANGKLRFFRNNGTGFSPGLELDFPGVLTSVAVADFDGNGALDPIVERSSPGGLSLVLLSCSGVPEVQSYDTGAGPYGIAAGDLDQDGHPDVVTANILGAGISIRLGVASVPRSCVSSVSAYTPALDFGLEDQGHTTTMNVLVTSGGPSPLHVTGLSTGNPEFTVLPYPIGSGIAAGQSSAIGVRFNRLATGPLAGSLTVSTDDPAQPELQVALSGYSLAPTTMAFSPGVLATPTLSASDTALQELVVRNNGLSLLHVQPSISSVGYDVPAALRTPAPIVDATAPLPRDMFDAGGFLWDIQPDGSVGTGTDGAFSNGLRRSGFPPQASARFEDGNRTLVLGPVTLPNGLQLVRKVFVSPSTPFARWTEIVSNSGAVPQTYHAIVLSTLGGPIGEPPRTSSGDGVLTTADDWIVLSDGDDAGGRPAIAQVFAASKRPTSTQLAGSGNSTTLGWDLVVPPAGVVAVAHWTAQAVARDDALALAQGLSQLGLGALEGLDASEQALLFSNQTGQLFGVTPASLQLAPGDSAVLTVHYRASVYFGSPVEAHGVLHLASNDALHPDTTLALALHVVAPSDSGDVVGVDPGPGPRLALRGLVPNPQASRAGATIAYTLSGAAPARLEMFDVRGRRIWSRDLEAPRAGEGMIRLAAGPRAAPGVVWIRLTQGGKVSTRKGILLP